ncbi:MAG: hypothetical protein K6357_07070 [Elusimicrobiota bacterium]
MISRVQNASATKEHICRIIRARFEIQALKQAQAQQTVGFTNNRLKIQRNSKNSEHRSLSTISYKLKINKFTQSPLLTAQSTRESGKEV